MPTLDAWLAAMPPEHEIDQRIGQLQAELSKLELIKQLHQQRSVPASTASRNGHSNGNGHQTASVRTPLFQAPAAASLNGSRLSRERRDIVQAMLTMPRGQGGPLAIAKKLHNQGLDTDHRKVGMNMARMERAGLLTRVRQGTYIVPPDVAQYVQQTADASPERVMP